MRRQLVLLLTGRQAHMTFDEAVADFPAWAMNQRAPNVAYTPWHILEHLRITQWDMLRYVRTRPATSRCIGRSTTGRRRTPRRTKPASGRRSSNSATTCARCSASPQDENVDLFAVLEGTPGHTAYRGIAIIGNHNSYHVGEFASLRQVMGSWGRSHN